MYKISIFCAEHATNMAAIGSSCLWLVNYRVFEIRRRKGDRFSAGPTEASYLAVLLSVKHFVVLYVMASIMRLYTIFFKGISLIPPINDNVTERLRITSLTGFAIYETWTYTTVIFRTKVA
jgi:hypothetical protein